MKAVCTAAVPSISVWKLAQGRGNPLEFIPAGSPHPHIALPALALAVRGAMFLCHKPQSAGAWLEGNWEQRAERDRTFPGDPLSRSA